MEGALAMAVAVAVARGGGASSGGDCVMEEAALCVVMANAVEVQDKNGCGVRIVVVQVVVSEEHGWVFVGIHDGFNGPDAPDYLLSNLYPAVHKELKGLLWDDPTNSNSSVSSDTISKLETGDLSSVDDSSRDVTEKSNFVLITLTLFTLCLLWCLFGNCFFIVLVQADSIAFIMFTAGLVLGINAFIILLGMWSFYMWRHGRLGRSICGCRGCVVWERQCLK